MRLSTTFCRMLRRAAAAALVLLAAACGSDTAQSLTASGKAFSAKNDHKAAVIQFKGALQLDPHSSEVRLLLANELLRAGDVDGAIVESNKALDDKAPINTVMPMLSKALLLAGEYRKLVSSYGELTLDDKPAQAALKANVATAWGALGDKAKTSAAIAASLAAQPDYGPAQILNARLLAGTQKYDEAMAVVESVLARDQTLHEAWLLKGELLNHARHDTPGAEAAYQMALKVEPTYVPAYVALISSRIVQRDFDGARALADKLRGVLPNHPLSTMVDAQLAFLSGKYPQAREAVQRLLRVFPDRPPLLILAGAVEVELGSVVQGESYFAKALSLNPNLEVARRNLAEADIRLGQYAKALDVLKPILSGSALSVQALALAGDAELRQGHAEAAEKYYVQAAKLDPDNVRLQTSATLTRLWRGDSAGAFAALETLSRKSNDTFVDEAIFAARIKRREFDAALSTLDTMVSKQPGKARHAEMRGRVHLARNDLVAARQSFEAALKLDPALFAATVALADIDLLENKPQQAVDRLQASVQASPQNAFALMALAELKDRKGAPYAEVKALLAQAIAAAPSNPDPRLRLIDLALRKRQNKDALAVARDAASALPQDARVLEAVGLAQMRAGDIEQAISTFRQMASTDTASAKPSLLLANVYLSTGKRSQAEAAINKALEIDPDSAPAQAALLDIMVSSNRERQALEQILRLRQRKPDQPLGYLLEGAYHARRGEVDAAAVAYREGLAKTKAPPLALALHSLLLLNKRVTEADQFAAQWIKQHPDDVAFDYRLAAVNITRNEFGPAEERLKRVIARDPSNALALNNLAWVLVASGRPGAVTYAQRAVDLSPDSPALMDTLASAMAAEKQPAAAMAMQKRAVELAPTDNGLRFNLAKLALQTGDKELARQELKRLQDLGPAYTGQAEVAKLMQTL